MQTTVFSTVQCPVGSKAFRRQSSCGRLCQTPRRRAAPRQARTRPPSVVSSALALDIASTSNAQAIINIVSAIIVGAGAWYYYRTQNLNKEGQQVCPRCQGSGVVECFCQRWSDNDVGCGTCGGSGKMICNSCNGGGTAVPIEAKVHIEPRNRPGNDSYYPARKSYSCRNTCSCTRHAHLRKAQCSAQCAAC